MKINRNNYEEYFLLYTDNELSVADKKAVEDFIRENPDLQKEFTMLQQTTFSADDTIVFSNKEVLMHEPVNESFIHHENCQEMFVLYFDDELTAEEKTAVERFVYRHPRYQEEFELIQSVKLIPDLSLTFPDKSKLYHRPEQGAKRVVFNWARLAVAAAVLMFAGVLWLAKPGKRVSNEIVKSGLKPSLRIQTQPVTPGIHVTPPAESAKKPLVAQAVSENKNLVPRDENPSSKKNLTANNVAQASVKIKIQKDDRGIARSGTKALPASSLPVTNQVREENSKTVQPEAVDPAIAVLPQHPAVSKPDAPAKPAVIHSLVQNQAADENTNVILASNDNEDAISIAGFPVDKKGSIRGLFRKASRFIDKTTSIRPVKKQGLVIGNIEIAFQ